MTGSARLSLKEFSELWVVDLKGNARTSGERRRQEGGNVFDDKIRVGVAVYFLVRRKGSDGFKVFYNAVDNCAKAFDKVAYISDESIDELKFVEITPDKYNDWLNQSDSDFEAMIPLANRQTKLAKDTAGKEATFGLYSLGVSTNRDEWVYDFAPDDLGRKVRSFIHGYEEIRALHGGTRKATLDLGNSIKWTRDLERQLRLDIANVFNRTSIRQAVSRPFVHKVLYFSRQLNEMQYQMPQVFPTGATDENKVICFPGNASSNGFQVLATDRVFSHDLLKTTQCLPLYRYMADGGRVSNITEWGLHQFREHYADDAITAEDIFAYTYSMLHDPAYRQTVRG